VSRVQRQPLHALSTAFLGGRPISEAAALAGFADQSHLSRWFVRYYGVTPGRYQRATAPTVPAQIVPV
jgi:AraC-like DNA-binding protein